MPSEAQRGLIRIGSNYGRLAVTFVMGLMLVPMLLEAVGLEGLGLISLLGSTVGIGAMLTEVLRNTSIRELGAVYHRKNEDGGKAFVATYNGALALGFACGCVTVGIFALMIVFAPTLFSLPEELIAAGRWFIVAQAAKVFISMPLSPAFNMYQITERNVLVNIWTTLERGCSVVAAGIVLLLPELSTPQAVVMYGILSITMIMVIHVTAVAVMVFYLEEGLIPNPRLITRQVIRGLVQMGGWNVTTKLAVDMHLRANNYLMNLWLGVGVGNGLFGGLAMPLASYTRMMAAGMIWGLSAVSARLSSLRGLGAIRALNYHTHRLQAMVMVPAAVALILLIHPILTIWVSRRLNDPTGELIDMAAVIVRLLAVGMVFRATGDGLINILYGAGHVKRYAPLLLFGGAANITISITLLSILPDTLKYIGPACAFAGIMLLVHGILLPIQGARIMEAPLSHMFGPLLRPMLLTAVCAPVLVSALYLFETWTLVKLIATLAAFGSLYGMLALAFILTAEERKRFGGSLLQKLTGKRRTTDEPVHL